MQKIEVKIKKNWFSLKGIIHLHIPSGSIQIAFPRKDFFWVSVLNSGWVESEILVKIQFQNKDENVEKNVFLICSVHSVFDKELKKIESSPRLQSGCSGICNTQKRF